MAATDGCRQQRMTYETDKVLSGRHVRVTRHSALAKVHRIQCSIVTGRPFGPDEIGVQLTESQTRHVKVANLSLALALALGGLTQLLAAMWEFVTGNTYAVTMFGMLSGFYLGAGTIFWAGSGIEDAYNGTGTWTHALGIYFSAWFIFSIIMLVASIRASVVMTTLWSSIVLTIMLAMISAFVEQVKVQKAAGAFGILTSAIAAWAGAAGIWTKDYAFFDLPTGSHRLDAAL